VPASVARIEILGQHDRAAFSCGKPDLDTYIREQASQDQRRNAAVCWVLPDIENPTLICGYYTLSAYSIRLNELPPDVARRFPRYPNVPAALLGRLAVDSRWRRRRLGEHLLLDAMARVLEQSDGLAIAALVVDARDSEAAAFYAHYDFIAFPTTPLRLFLSMKTIKQLLL
jgi:GNAT superfamily N-acetyltransferase